MRIAPKAEAGAGQHAIAWLILLGLTAALFLQSFQAWGDPFIDLGRDLYVPSQLLAGRLLYRDLIYNYGPTTPYLLAALVAVFGDPLWLFAGFGIACGLATMGALYWIGWRLAGVWAGFATALLFLVLNFFANTTWGCNFVLPYAYAAVLGTAFACWSFAFLLDYLYRGRAVAPMVASTAMLVLAVLTKVEIGAAIGVVHLVAWWAHRVPLRLVAMQIGALALACGIVVAIFSVPGGGHGLLSENLFHLTGAGAGEQVFSANISGFDRPGEAIATTIAAGAAPVLLVALANLAMMAFRALSGGARGRALALVLVGVLAAILPFLLESFRANFAQFPVLRATVWGALVLVGLSLWRDRRSPLLLLGMFVIASAPRILLRYDPGWYGFYLNVPAYPFLVYALGVRLPQLSPEPWATRGALAGFTLALLVGFNLGRWGNYGDMTSELVTAKGTLRDYPLGRLEALRGFLDSFAAAKPDRDAGLVVFPEGVSLNYFTGIANPTAYYLFTPPELTGDTQTRIIAELEAEKPAYLAYVPRDLSEFGVHHFGEYALPLAQWIDANYRATSVFGSEGRFQIVLLERTTDAKGTVP